MLRMASVQQARYGQEEKQSIIAGLPALVDQKFEGVMHPRKERLETGRVEAQAQQERKRGKKMAGLFRHRQRSRTAEQQFEMPHPRVYRRISVRWQEARDGSIPVDRRVAAQATCFDQSRGQVQNGSSGKQGRFIGCDL